MRSLLRLLCYSAGCSFVAVMLSTPLWGEPFRIEKPGHDAREAQEAGSRRTHFRVRCPEGQARIGPDCGLLAYYWYSEQQRTAFKHSDECRAKPDDCEHAHYRQFSAMLSKRYAWVDISAPGQICQALPEALNCDHPLLRELLWLLIHNYTLKHYPNGITHVSSAADAREIRERTELVVKALIKQLRVTLKAHVRRLPDRDCPQLALSRTECEGPPLLLRLPWTATPYILPVRLPEIDSGS